MILSSTARFFLIPSTINHLKLVLSLIEFNPWAQARIVDKISFEHVSRNLIPCTILLIMTYESMIHWYYPIIDHENQKSFKFNNDPKLLAKMLQCSAARFFLIIRFQARLFWSMIHLKLTQNLIPCTSWKCFSESDSKLHLARCFS